MAGFIILTQGDLIEFEIGEGHIDIDPKTRVRGIVIGFEIILRDEGDEFGIWIYEGRNDHIITIEKKKGNKVNRVSQYNSIDKGIVCITWDDLKQRNFEVIRDGNSPREMTNFEVKND